MVNVKKIHKGWFYLALAVLIGLACLGFGRFSYGAILPFMKDGLQLNYKETGWLASAIFLGYVIGAVNVGRFVKLMTTKKVIIISLSLIIFGMLGTSVSLGFRTAYAFSFLVGFGSGVANVATMSVVSAWFAPRKRGMALGIMNVGNGIGIVFSGMVVPVIVTSSAGSGWRISWMMLAILVLAITFINMFLLKTTPEEAGLKPVGYNPNYRNVNGRPSVQSSKKDIYKNPLLWSIGLFYMLWGFSYIIFSTFLVDYFIEDVGLNEHFAGRIYAVAGFTSVLSGFLWGIISDRIGRMLTLSIVFFFQMTILISLNMSTNGTFLLLEAILYSFAMWAVPTVVIASIGDFVEPKLVPSGIGFMTLFFGTGQLIGPIIVGYLVDLHGSYSHAFNLSAVACLIAGTGNLFVHFRFKKTRVKSRGESELGHHSTN